MRLRYVSVFDSDHKSAGKQKNEKKKALEQNQKNASPKRKKEKQHFVVVWVSTIILSSAGLCGYCNLIKWKNARPKSAPGGGGLLRFDFNQIRKIESSAGANL